MTERPRERARLRGLADRKEIDMGQAMRPGEAWLDLSGAEDVDTSGVRWFATGDATEPMKCTRCGAPLDGRGFSVGADGATHDDCDPSAVRPEA